MARLTIMLILNSLLILLLSCSSDKTYTVEQNNNVKIIRNKNKGANPDLEIKLKKLFDLKFSQLPEEYQNFMIHHLAYDRKDNLFISCQKSSRIIKISSQGKFLTSFCRKGDGPGEVRSSKAMVIADDTVFVCDLQTAKVVKYTTDGRFAGKLNTPFPFINQLKSLGKSGFIGHFIREIQKDDGVYFTADLNIIDQSFQKVRTLSSVSTKMDAPGFNFLDIFFPYTVDLNNREIYVGEVSEDRYMFSILDYQGNLKQRVFKNYQKKKLSKEEIDKLKLWAKMENIPHSPKIYHNSMQSFQFDNHNRLWITNRADKSIDIFKGGIFQKNISLPEVTSYFEIINDKLIQHNKDDDKKLTIYQILN